jgi:hypothetical protein
MEQIAASADEILPTFRPATNLSEASGRQRELHPDTVHHTHRRIAD